MNKIGFNYFIKSFLLIFLLASGQFLQISKRIYVFDFLTVALALYVLAKGEVFSWSNRFLVLVVFTILTATVILDIVNENQANILSALARNGSALLWVFIGSIFNRIWVCEIDNNAETELSNLVVKIGLFGAAGYQLGLSTEFFYLIGNGDYLGFIKKTNFFAAVPAIMLSLRFLQNRFDRYLYVVVGLLAIVFGDSRIGGATLIAVGLLQFFRWKRIFAVKGLVTILLVSPLVLSESVLQIIAETNVASGNSRILVRQDVSKNQREEVIQRALEDAYQSYTTGLGGLNGLFSVDNVYYGIVEETFVHSVAVSLFYEYGIVGCFFVFLIIWMLYRAMMTIVFCALSDGMRLGFTWCWVVVLVSLYFYPVRDYSRILLTVCLFVVSYLSFGLHSKFVVFK
jgi:hypothetical protein